MNIFKKIFTPARLYSIAKQAQRLPTIIATAFAVSIIFWAIMLVGALMEGHGVHWLVIPVTAGLTTGVCFLSYWADQYIKKVDTLRLKAEQRMMEEDSAVDVYGGLGQSYGGLGQAQMSPALKGYIQAHQLARQNQPNLYQQCQQFGQVGMHGVGQGPPAGPSGQMGQPSQAEVGREND